MFISLSNCSIARPDSVIVDTNSDLNIYTTAKEDGPAQGCCGGTASCVPASAEVKNIDFNEWAGMYPFSWPWLTLDTNP